MAGRKLQIVLVTAALFSATAMSGCNLFAPFFFFHYLTGADTRWDPDYKIREGDKEKPTRIMVLTYCPANTRPEYAGLDRELNDKVSRTLFKGLAADKKLINVIKADVVKKWIDDHPDWKSMEAEEIGRAMEADFVICIQVDDFRLFQDEPSRTMVQGRCDITLRIVPIDPSDDLVGIETIPMKLESPGGPQLRTQMNESLRQYRDRFIVHLAERISWKFLPHPKEDEFRQDSLR